MLRGALALLGAAVGLRSLDADAARRGYSGPGESDNGNGTADISIQTAISGQVGVCRLAAFVTGAPPGATVLIGIDGDVVGGPSIHERFSVKADDQGRVAAYTTGTFSGLISCIAVAGWGWEPTIHSPARNLRCY
jgi:hypothetical protein